jgi:hypothetical protein
VTARNFSGESGALTGIVVTGAAGTPVAPPVVDHSGGFTDTSDLFTYWPARSEGGRLRLTDGGFYETSFALTNDVVPVRTFTTAFDFQSAGGADGFTFVLHNFPYDQVWLPYYVSGGSYLGYGGGYLPNSIALKFDLYKPSGNNVASTTGLYFNGQAPIEDANEINTIPSGVNFHSGHVMHVVISYDGETLVQSIQDTVTNAVFSHEYKVDIPAIVNGGTAHAGFTAATGGLVSTQDILNWTYTDVAGGLAPAAPDVTPIDIGSDEGAQFSGAVASFLADDTVGGTPTFTATIDWGDGTTTAGHVAVGFLSGYFVTGQHTYADSGAYDVTVMVVDERNGAASIEHAAATVANLAPVASLTGFPPSAPEGGALAGAGSATDPSSADQATLAYTWAVLKNGTSFASGTGAAPSFTPDDNGTYVVTLTATDKDGGSSSASQTIDVTNVAPTVALAGAAMAAGVRGQSLDFTGSFTDPGSADTWSATVNYGDGGGPQPLVLGPGKTFSLSHAYAAAGNYTITVRVADDDGGAGSATKAVNVTATGMQPDPVDPTKTQLAVGGTSGNNVITLRSGPGNTGAVEVVIDGVSQGTFNPTGRIVVFGGAGNDILSIDQRSRLPAELYGGDGNDVLNAGGGGSILVGGAGDDVLAGGAGRDLLIGGAGADALAGMGDEDILIAGSTSHDGDPAALRALLAEWKRTDATYATRISHLRSGGGLNGASRLAASDLFDDTSADVLTGGPGNDWLVFNSAGPGVRDRALDASAGETVTDL